MAAPPLLGGLGEEKPADEEVQELCDLVKPEYVKESGENVAEFKADSYRSQMVSGTNYYVKVKTGEDKYCHLYIHKPLPHTGEKPQLKNYQCGKSKTDPIQSF